MLCDSGPLTKEQYATLQQLQQRIWEANTNEPPRANDNETTYAQMQYAKGHISEPHITREEKEMIDGSSSDDSIPAEAIADMIDQMKTHKRDELLNTLRTLADRSGRIQSNAILGILSNISPRRKYAHERQTRGMSELDRRLARIIDESTAKKVKRRTEKWLRALEKNNLEEQRVKAKYNQHEYPKQQHADSPHKSQLSYSTLNDAEGLNVKRATAYMSSNSPIKGVGTAKHGSTHERTIRTPNSPTSTWKTIQNLPCEQLTPLQQQQRRELKHNMISLNDEQSFQRMVPTHGGISAQTIHLSQREPPKMDLLRSIGSEAIARWQNKLTDWNHEVARYRITHPHFVPRLSECVTKGVWRRISVDLLKKGDKSDIVPAPGPDSVTQHCFFDIFHCCDIIR